MHKKKSIKTPEELINLFHEYVASIGTISVPVVTIKGVIYKDVPEPIHWKGFNVFLFKKGIIKDAERYQYNLHADSKDAGFVEASKYISSYIFEHNYKYAAVEMHNPRLTSMLLSLEKEREERLNEDISIKLPEWMKPKNDD